MLVTKVMRSRRSKETSKCDQMACGEDGSLLLGCLTYHAKRHQTPSRSPYFLEEELRYRLYVCSIVSDCSFSSIPCTGTQRTQEAEEQQQQAATEG